MKSTLKFGLLFFIFMCVLLTCADINSVTQRKAELDQATHTALRNSLKSSTTSKMYDVEDMELSAGFLRNFAQNIESDGDFDVYVNEASTEGLMDVYIETRFMHLNGKTGMRDIRKTLVLEDIPKEETE